MKVRVLILLAAAAILTGCSGGGPVTTISGYVYLNGVPATNDQVTLWVSANSLSYGGDTINSSGYFIHSSASNDLDPEFCVPGKVVTLIFDPNDGVDGAISTRVYQYTVQEGANDLGIIDIGAYGFGLDVPADGLEVTDWPATFSWTAYSREGITPSYILKLFTSFFCFWQTTLSGTSHDLLGTEELSLIGDSEPIGGGDRSWKVTVEYTENGHTMQHISDIRTVTLPDSPGL